MNGDPKIGDNLPRSMRIRRSMRAHWAGHKTFTASQIARLQEAIRTNHFAGGMTTTDVPATSLPAQRGTRSP